MTKIVVFILLQLALNIELFSQEIALKSTGNHHLLFSGLSHWNTTRVSNISGSVDKVRTATTLGFVFDIGYKYIGSRFSVNASLGHGFYNEEVYYEYNEISEPDFSYTSDKSFEKNSPLQYSSVKLFLSKRISKSKRTTLSVGFDFRVNWGYKIIMDDFERNDISFGGKQDLGGTPLLGDFTQLYQFNSELEKNLSINPLIGLDYDFNILNQKSLTFGVLYSIPLFRILSSNVVIYPDYDDLRSTFNTKYYGGFFGFRVIYSMPIGMCQ